MERREFVKACTAGALLAAGNPSVLAAMDARPRLYSKTLLVLEGGRPLKASDLVAHRNYVFHYPYAGTPCFLLDLGKPAGEPVELKTAKGDPYRWTGGVGAKRSVVAYSAICAHQLTYPTKQISFISYRDDKTPSPSGNANVIHCCSEHSQYDPARGGKVLGGPASQPLAAILLEHDPAADRLYAVGTLGGEMFDEFFRRYDFRLALEHGGGKAKGAVGEQSVVSELAQYCRQQVQC